MVVLFCPRGSGATRSNHPNGGDRMLFDFFGTSRWTVPSSAHSSTALGEPGLPLVWAKGAMGSPYLAGRPYGRIIQPSR